MSIELTADALRKIFPRAPQPVLDAFLAKQNVLEFAGVNHTRNRLAYAFAQLEHESSGFTRMREGTHYTPQRAALVFPKYFPTADIAAPYTQNPRLFFNKVYGGRMGNRPGTDDGWEHIGRGGPQITGRDGYHQVAVHSGVDFDSHPDWMERAEYQPDVTAGFIKWKKLNAKADLGDFLGYVKVWNGGTNGLKDRETLLAGNSPYIDRLKTVDAIKPIAKDLPGAPPTKEPPQEAIDEVTTNERKARNGGAAAAGAGGAGEIANQTAAPPTKTGTVQPDKPPSGNLVAPLITFGLLGAGVAVFVLMCVLMAKKKAVVQANWN